MITKILLAAAVLSMPLLSQPKTVLYAAVGNELTQYDLDTSAATLTKRASIAFPANIQEAWRHPSGKYLYVAWSNGGAASAPANGVAPKGNQHGISAFLIDPATGNLSPHGAPEPLPSRPIYITTDVPGTHIIAAHNDPSRLTVYRIMPNGTLGAPVEQSKSLDFGIYGHQVRADPSGKTVILVTRGNAPTATTPEDPGALKVFGYKDGVLSGPVSIAPNKGFGYQIRHIDFHPSGKWTFATLERQNQLQVYGRKPDGNLSPAPLFVKSTLMKTTKDGAGQTASSIHFNPNGKFVYVANRGGTDGENSIAVFAVNEKTGEPTLIQSIATRGLEPRTFAVDSSGKVLAVANQNAGPGVSASLVLYSIGENGTLEFRHKYDIPTSPGHSLFWTGIFSLTR